MAIIAASIEANGWVLRLTITGSLGSFASYALTPDATPKVVLASSHPGFVPSAGQAISANLARTLFATIPVRKPVNLLSPTVKVVDETDLGGGQIRVRLALTEHVYATDTGLGLTVLAGWRSGEPAASNITVTNGSTIVAPIPIMRWALVPYDVTSGSFRLSLIVVSHHPVGFQPVAGVRFSVTDGTTVKTQWVTALATDNSLGDNLRCYTTIIDPATATALTGGLLRCDAQVYPWLGAVRTTDPAGTRSMSNIRLDGYGTPAQSPFVIGYDPAGTRYGAMWAYVDPVNGSTTASAAMIATSQAGAIAVAAASRPRDVGTAVQAGYLSNRTLAAANGQAAQTRSVDGLKIMLAPGTHIGCGPTAITSGIATAEIPVFVIGDPTSADPRNTSIWQASSTTTQRLTRLRIANLTLEVGGAGYGNANYIGIDNVTIRGRAGQETNSTGYFTNTLPAAGYWSLSVTRSRQWRHAAGLNLRIGLFRGNEHSQTAQGLCFVRNRFISTSEDGFSVSNRNCHTVWALTTELGAVEDLVTGWNDMRSVGGRAISYATAPAALAGTPNPSVRRHAVIGNIVERIGNDPQPLWSIGEDTSATMSYNIIEANTTVGDRTNTFYSDPVPTTLAETDSLLNQAFVNRIANNALDLLPSKHDMFADPTTQSVRAAAGVSNPTGYRPQMIEAWSMIHGVGHESNFDAGRAGITSYALEYAGLRTTQNLLPVSAGFVSDRSLLGSGVGGGDYRPLAGSPLLNRVLRGNSDVDFSGLARISPSVAGALQSANVALLPAGTLAATRSGQPGLGIAFQLATAGGRIAHRAGPAPLAWATLLAPAAAAVRSSDSGTMLALVIGLSPSNALLAQGAAEGRVTVNAAALIGPGNSMLVLRSLAPLLLDAVGRSAVTLDITADIRTLFIINP